MKKSLVLLLVLLFAAGMLSAEGNKEAAAQQPIKLVFHAVSVPNDAHTKAMYEFEKVLENISGGRFDVEVHHSGALYTQEAETAAIRRGNLDMAYLGPNWLAEYVPYISMFAAPYIFDSYEHMTQTFNGPIGQKISDDVAKEIGIRPLGAYYLGTRQINLRDIGREVRTPQDMRGVKLRMPGTPTWQFMGKALGANPTPLSFTEVYLALKTGTIDGQDNPLPTDKNAKFYEVTKYIILTDHFINPIMPTINEKKWQSFTDQEKQWVLQAVDSARKLCDTLNLEQEAELVEFFRNEGLTVIEPNKAAFKEYALQMVMGNKEMTGSWDMELFDQVQQLAKKLGN